MTKVFFIHGINNQGNSKKNIEQTWSRALIGGAKAAGVDIPESVIFKAAFYGDLLQIEEESWGAAREAAQPMSESAPEQDYIADDGIVGLYREYMKKYEISEGQVVAELEQGDDFPFYRRQAKGVHKKWLKAIARALEKVLPTKGRYVAKAFLGQAAAYLHKPGLKEKIDDIVREQLVAEIEGDEKLIIISHSLGTIIAYELMRRFRHEIKLKLLVTAGSPLGVEIVKKRLGPPLTCLPSVDKWINISDKEDFVALETRLDKSTFGCGKIENIDGLDNGPEDAHDILKYLGHKAAVTKIVSEL